MNIDVNDYRFDIDTKTLHAFDVTTIPVNLTMYEVYLSQHFVVFAAHGRCFLGIEKHGERRSNDDSTAVGISVHKVGEFVSSIGLRDFLIGMFDRSPLDWAAANLYTEASRKRDEEAAASLSPTQEEAPKPVKAPSRPVRKGRGVRLPKPPESPSDGRTDPSTGVERGGRTPQAFIDAIDQAIRAARSKTAHVPAGPARGSRRCGSSMFSMESSTFRSMWKTVLPTGSSR